MDGVALGVDCDVPLPEPVGVTVEVGDGLYDDVVLDE